MQLKTILNHVARHKSFVYHTVRWADAKTKTEIEILIEPRANSRAICSGCGQPSPGYDRLAERRFEFVPLWQIAVYFVHAMRRVDCPRCGVQVEQVPWCDGKHGLTTTYRWFFWPAGRNDFRGREWPSPLARRGRTCFARSITRFRGD